MENNKTLKEVTEGDIIPGATPIVPTKPVKPIEKK